MKILKLSAALLTWVISNAACADGAKFLTVDELIDNGYTLLSGQQILDIMQGSKIEVVDIETKAVTVSEKINKSDSGMGRKFVETKNDSAASLLNAKLLARAPMLEGEIKRKVVGDELIASDGLRSYHYRLYQKKQKIYAVRDIDYGNVFLEVKVK